jgi:hypothetical protein
MSTPEDLPERRDGRTYGVPARRARIIELLKAAYARDDLDQAEFELRVERAEGARTIEELDRLVEDFPAHLKESTASPAPQRRETQLTADTLKDELMRLDGLSAPTTFNLIGDKHVLIRPEDPRVVRTVSVIGDCSVDLRALAGASGAVSVKVASLIGDTRIVVTHGTTVDFRLFSVIGDQKRVSQKSGLRRRLARKLGILEEPDAKQPAPPGPRVVISGFKLIGDIVVVED